MANLKPSLIKSCLCGRSNFIHFIHQSDSSQIPIRECLGCGIKHQLVHLNYEEYLQQYISDYSHFTGKDGGELISSERYLHDFKLAEIRYESYKPFLPIQSVLLDVGSSNGAFVDFMNQTGMCTARGLEICEEYNHRKVTYSGDFLSVELQDDAFDVITMHDILEHFVNPGDALLRCNRILRKDGILIIDFPDFFSRSGFHHWKVIEHLWILRLRELKWLVQYHGFKVIRIDKPIPSKFVLICGFGEEHE